MLMKRILTSLYIFSILFLLSCQKESGFSDNNGSGGASGTGLLSKLVSKSGSDSSVLVFGYNSSKKLINLNITLVSGGTTATVQERAERNGQGIIQKLILKSDFYQQAGFDSVVTVLRYNSGRYTSKVTSFDLSVVIIKDSVALSYDGSGKVVSERAFVDDGSNAYEEYRKVEYTYNGNNISTLKTYSFDSGTSSYTLEEAYTYDQYDDKASPLYFGVEAFIFDSPFFISANNILKSSLTAGGTTENYTITYTYNSSGKPLTAVSTIQPGNSTSTGTYYYQ